jgi:hypothetical protein
MKEHRIPCPVCDGTGWMNPQQETGNVICPQCMGSKCQQVWVEEIEPKEPRRNDTCVGGYSYGADTAWNWDRLIRDIGELGE